jgi:membrane-bound ClpP family serine protease
VSTLTGRLIIAVISTILEEAAIAVIVLWGLPQININIPLWGMIMIMVAWLTYSIFTFRMGTRALKKTPVGNLPNMVGSKGEVVSRLAPQGIVKIKGELWVAKSASGDLESGGEVIVVEQNRLKLVVRDINTHDDNLKATE